MDKKKYSKPELQLHDNIQNITRGTGGTEWDDGNLTHESDDDL
jgi:hypothetical protein